MWLLSSFESAQAPQVMHAFTCSTKEVHGKEGDSTETSSHSSLRVEPAGLLRRHNHYAESLHCHLSTSHTSSFTALVIGIVPVVSSNASLLLMFVLSVGVTFCSEKTKSALSKPKARGVRPLAMETRTNVPDPVKLPWSSFMCVFWKIHEIQYCYRASLLSVPCNLFILCEKGIPTWLYIVIKVLHLQAYFG